MTIALGQSEYRCTFGGADLWASRAVRHRSEVVEYRIDQHWQRLRDRLTAFEHGVEAMKRWRQQSEPSTLARSEPVWDSSWNEETAALAYEASRDTREV
jgi:hypothetical protein